MSFWTDSLAAHQRWFWDTPAPMPKHEQDTAEQFYEDGVSAAQDLLSEMQRGLVRARDGYLGAPAANDREDVLTSILSLAAKVKMMREGAI